MSGAGSALAVAVALVGPRAVGKTTVGRELARLLDYAFVDGDELLAAAAGRPAGAHLAAVGEPRFRELEAAVVVPALQAAQRAVVALGGGAVTIAAVRAALRRPGLFVVQLDAEPAVLAARLAADATERPPLTALPIAQEVAALRAQRTPFYAEVAHARFAADRATPRELAQAIAAALRDRIG